MSNINSQATVNLTVNGQQPLQVLQMLKQRAMELENAIAKAAMAGNKVELRKLRRELSDTKRQMREIETSTQQVERVMLRLDRATPKELNKTLQTLNRQLEYMERGSAAWNAHVAKIQRVKAELAKVNAELRTQESFWTRFNRKLNDWQTSLMGIAALVTGLVMAGSPTVNVGYAAVEELPRVRHEKPMLSLDKTKSREDLASWLGEQKGLLSWKLDGLTVVLTYEGGRLTRAVTRGNGEIGEEITANASTFRNLPAKIPFAGRLTLRGEAVIPDQ